MMLKFNTDAMILFPGLELPPRSMIGMSESLEVDGEYTDDRSLQGNLILLRPAYAPGNEMLYRATLSNSGDNVVRPSMDDLMPGTAVTFYSGEWWNVTIPAGQLSRNLRRPPVPGSLMGGNPGLIKPDAIPLTLVGLTASLAGLLDHSVTVYYRPAFEMTVVSHAAGTNSRTAKSRGYGLVLAENGPLA